MGGDETGDQASETLKHDMREFMQEWKSTTAHCKNPYMTLKFALLKHLCVMNGKIEKVPPMQEKIRQTCNSIVVTRFVVVAHSS